MAGIGPICTNSRDDLKRAERSTSLTASANELEIFYNLCAGRVFFKKSISTLYFVDSPIVSVSQIIHAVFRGFNRQPCIKQLYMDEHNLIKAACCISLTTARQSKPVLVALRMHGIYIDIS